MKALGTISVLFVILIFSALSIEAAGPVAEGYAHADKSAIHRKEAIRASAALTHYIVGLVSHNHGNPSKAVEQYNEALSYAPGQPVVITRLGAELLLLGETEKAMEELGRAISKEAPTAEPYLLMAIVHASRGEYGEAEDKFARALEMDPPDREKVLTMLADMHILQKDFPAAAKIYEDLAEKKKRPSRYFNLGVLYAKLQELEKAAISLEKAVELDETYLEAQLFLGNIYQFDGKYAEAIEQYEKVVALDPYYLEAYARLSDLYNRVGLHEKALEENRKIMEIDPENTESYLRSSRIYLGKGDLEKAKEVLTDALKRDLDVSAVYSGLGYIAFTEENYDEAAEYYRKALDEAGDNDEGYFFYLATALYQGGRREEAVEVLEKKVLEDKDFFCPDVYNFLGYAYAERGENLERAVELVKRALEADPDNGAYLDSLGWAYYKMGEYEKALSYLERAAEKLPEESVVLGHYAAVLEKKGEYVEALTYWRRAIRLDEYNVEYRQRLKRLQEKMGQ